MGRLRHAGELDARQGRLSGYGFQLHSPANLSDFTWFFKINPGFPEDQEPASVNSTCKRYRLRDGPVLAPADLAWECHLEL